MIIPDKSDVPYRFLAVFNAFGEEYPETGNPAAGVYLVASENVSLRSGESKEVATGIRTWCPANIGYTIGHPGSDHAEGLEVMGYRYSVYDGVGIVMRLYNAEEETIDVKVGDVIGNLEFCHNMRDIVGTMWTHVFIWPEGEMAP